MMHYVIICNGKEIAKFLHESDRDLCLGLLKETYDDVDLEAAEAAEEPK